jgi:hypothetical protein
MKKDDLALAPEPHIVFADKFRIDGAGLLRNSLGAGAAPSKGLAVERNQGPSKVHVHCRYRTINNGEYRK